MLKQRIVIITYCIICFVNAFSAIISKDINSEISIYDLFNPNADLRNGIIGTVNPNGKIEIRVFDKATHTLLYQIQLFQTSLEYSGTGRLYNRADLGGGAIYYPNQWNSLDIKTSLLGIDRKRADVSTQSPYPLLHNNLEINIQIIQDNANLKLFRLPGVGVVDGQGGNALFHPGHYCYDLKNNNSFPTRAWSKLKMPDISKGSDLAIAAHRGVWGDNLGAGNPENSIASIVATKQYTDILESDVMIMADKNIVVTHDYNMHRLSNYTGSEKDYLFNMNWSQLSNLNLRKRNMDVSQYKYLTFASLVDLLIQYNLVLTVDIKDIRARYKNGVCVDNCEYDPKTHGDAASKKIKDSWMEILKKCIEIAKSKNALQYLAFKVPHEYSDMTSYIPDTTLSQVLFMPVIQPNRSDYLTFTDSWIQNGNNRVVAYETNFKQKNDTYLQPFDRNGVHYQNFLHYIYARTGLRPGCYPEEPMGPKGIVNRWADWLIKDLRKDVRGDHYFLMTIPYGKIMILTTDRPDIWQKIDNMYNAQNN